MYVTDLVNHFDNRNCTLHHGETKSREYLREVQESKIEVVWILLARRDQEYVGRKTLEMVPPGRRKRGRPKQRWMDCVNRDMRAIGTTKDEVRDRTGWRRIVSTAATPLVRAASRGRNVHY